MSEVLNAANVEVQDNPNTTLSDDKLEKNTTSNRTTKPSVKRYNPKTEPIAYVTSIIANAVSGRARTSQVSEVNEKVTDVLRTIFALCATDRYSSGVVVEGFSYRYSDYAVPKGLDGLIVANAVTASDSMTSVDFLNHSVYKLEGRILSPAELKQWCLDIASALRGHVDFVSVNKAESEPIANAVKYSVTGGNTADTTGKTLYVLSSVFDNEAKIPLKEWAINASVDMFR